MKKIIWALLSVFALVSVLAAPAEAKTVPWNFWNLNAAPHAKKYIPAYQARLPAKKISGKGAIVVAHINVASQTMSVSVNGWPEGNWKVSTARAGYHTPRGSYRAVRMARVYYSKKYDNSPMPNSVFFYGGYAIHGTGHISGLGRPASHGCVRLHPSNAASFFDLVQRYGMSRTRITIS